jgi:anaerobic selenocysteine-containing dehydrogenase
LRRRDFLKASALGAGVSLLEACRGQDEQFIAQLARRPGVLQGESVWRPSVCSQCAAGCGIHVRVVDGNAKKIEGNPDHPVNRGGVCALGHSLLQEIYNPDRMLDPQRRVGERGEGRFDGLSWEEGLAEAVDALAGVPADRIAIVGADRAGLTSALLSRFAASLGAPSPTFLEPPELEVERRAAQISLGVDELPYFDVARSDYVLSIGSPILDRWRSPVHYTSAFAEMRRGRLGRRGKLVQAEARMSLTAANADEWLAVRPGTEGVLARGVAGVLLAQDLVPEAGRMRYGRLFSDEAPNLDEVAELCDVSAEKIRRIAQELGAAENRVVVAGGSAAAHSNGLSNVVAALGLNLLLDNLGRPGGVFAPVDSGLARGVAPAGSRPTSVAALAARLRGESDTPVELLLVVDADPLHSVPASWGLGEALADVESIVALSSFHDDTTLHADLVLPLNTELERFNAVEPAASVGLPVLGLTRAVVDPLGTGNHPADVILALATALGDPVAASFPWSSFENLVRTRIEEELEGLPGAAGLDPSDYYAEALARGGIFGDGAPQVAPPGPTGPSAEPSLSRFDGAAAEYPYLLLPFESLKTASGRGANRPWLQELPDPLSTVMWDSWVELAPSDAEELGVHDGDHLRLTSAAGTIEAQAVIDPTVRPGVVGMPVGQGHREYGRYARGRGANPLDLVGRLQVDDTSAPAWAATRIRVERLAPGELARSGRSYTERGEGERIPVGWAPQDAGREDDE